MICSLICLASGYPVNDASLLACALISLSRVVLPASDHTACDGVGFAALMAVSALSPTLGTVAGLAASRDAATLSRAVAFSASRAAS